MRRCVILCVLMAVLLCALPALAEETADPFNDAGWPGSVIRSYDGDTLQYAIREFEYGDALCYLTHIRVADPGRQIVKATADWEENIMLPSDMAARLDETPVLAVNGSGYVSPTFPWIPENYPGTNEDYYYTPLGSLTVTNGTVFRNLAGVPYYGLTLQADGLHLHIGEDNEAVLAQEPTQTWSFYVQCPMISDHESILDEDWTFAQARAIRTIIARLEDGSYVILTVTNLSGHSLSLIQCVMLLRAYVDPLWAYDLDGGPSSALLVRNEETGDLETLFGGTSKDADIMAFIE